MSNPYQNSNGTFENKLGIQKADELKLIEYDLTTQKSNQILNDEVSLGVKGYGLERQQAIHKYLFEDIYEWAGKIRTIPYSKSMGNGLTTIFAQPNMIKTDWKKLEQKTEEFVNAKGLTL
ncbi:Fic family protein [Kingella kingae]|uniref:Fic family protein n=1 Tax=Kingella kingae TaxID=504 RepID=UPI00254D1925|nr:Fic family protein [Kingella kingae]MDK4574541.1 Fic family protein [Kingella kingae]MDK4576420.1 Fic family protein [Kingella kingae]MDK4582470.1 Fic family protein [Kingella kingae]MDK4592556.1 Fic family protein [Kingella kingae]MDK4594663.1 Fic family protein [Kingella kingae]